MINVLGVHQQLISFDGTVQQREIHQVGQVLNEQTFEGSETDGTEQSTVEFVDEIRLKKI
jgi:hypothetical protein